MPEHDHAGHPEEQDVEAGDQQRGRVERRQILGLVGPAERRERPQPGAEPGVEHVGILLRSRRSAVGAGGRVFARHDDLVALVAMPRRNAMAPPELARDAPVADVVHPLVVGLRPVLGNELDAAVFHDAMACSASGFILTNHCVETSGSTGVLQRWHLPSGRRCIFGLVEAGPRSSRSATTCLRASKRSSPA